MLGASKYNMNEQNQLQALLYTEDPRAALWARIKPHLPRKSRVNLLGRLCGRLKVVEYIGIDLRRKQTLWRCRCICGNPEDVFRHTVQLTSITFRHNCGCIAREENKFKPRLKPFEHMFRRFLKNCEKRGYSNSLTYEDFVKFSNTKICHYCDEPICWEAHGQRSGSQYHLDRKDNAVDYTINNCVVCCKRCNYLKGAKFTYDEWKAMAKAYYEVRSIDNART